MQILIYPTDSGELIYFDMGTYEKRKRAYLTLFNYLDKICNYYQYVENKKWLLLLGKARNGDWECARHFLTQRLFHKHEFWYTVKCITDEQMNKWNNALPYKNWIEKGDF